MADSQVTIRVSEVGIYLQNTWLLAGVSFECHEGEWPGDAGRADSRPRGNDNGGGSLVEEIAPVGTAVRYGGLPRNDKFGWGFVELAGLWVEEIPAFAEVTC